MAPGLRTAEQIQGAAQLLVAAGWLSQAVPSVRFGPRARVSYTVNPRLRPQTKTELGCQRGQPQALGRPKVSDPSTLSCHAAIKRTAPDPTLIVNARLIRLYQRQSDKQGFANFAQALIVVEFVINLRRHSD